MKTIVTLTLNPAIDKSSVIERVYPEVKLRCAPPAYDPGGGGINVSRAIKRLGGESVAIYPAGGTTGELLRGLMDGEGIEHKPVSIEALTRENFTILETSTDQQFRFVMPGVPLKEAEWQECLNRLKAIRPEPGYIVASGSLPLDVPDDFYARVSEVARAIGARLVVDTSGESLKKALKAGVYLIKPNTREIAELGDKEVGNEGEAYAVAKEIVERGESELVVASLGAGGALLASKEGCVRLRAPVVPIISKVGAGDSMVGGMVLKLAEGWSPEEAARYGIAAGAAAVMTPGTELCRLEDTERLYESIKGE
ncbi:MAG: 1-phosphofructokinase family hexose kinase [Dehalococcoidia bacterium]